MEKVLASRDSDDMAKACLFESQLAKSSIAIAIAGSASGQETCNQFAY